MLEDRMTLFVRMCFWGFVTVICWIATVALPFLILAGFIWVAVAVLRALNVLPPA